MKNKIFKTDKKLRENIKTIIKNWEDSAKKLNLPKHNFSITDFDEFELYLKEIQIANTNDSHKNFNELLNLIYIEIYAFSMLSLAIHQDEDDEFPVFPKNSLSEEKIPDPNLVMQHIFVQITNYSLSIAKLLESGLFHSAAIIYRVLQELCGITLVISADINEFKTYINLQNETSNSKRNWEKNFSPKIINAKLFDLERKYNMPFEMIIDLQKIRNDNFSFCSQVVHNYYSHISWGSYSVSFENEEDLNSSLYGSIGKESEYLLNELYILLMYTLLFFYDIIFTVHKFKAPPDNMLWRTAVMLYKCVTEYPKIRENSAN